MSPHRPGCAPPEPIRPLTSADRRRLALLTLLVAVAGGPLCGCVGSHREGRAAPEPALEGVLEPGALPEDRSRLVLLADVILGLDPDATGIGLEGSRRHGAIDAWELRRHAGDSSSLGALWNIAELRGVVPEAEHRPLVEHALAEIGRFAPTDHVYAAHGLRSRFPDEISSAWRIHLRLLACARSSATSDERTASLTEQMLRLRVGPAARAAPKSGGTDALDAVVRDAAWLINHGHASGVVDLREPLLGFGEDISSMSIGGGWPLRLLRAIVARALWIDGREAEAIRLLDEDLRDDTAGPPGFFPKTYARIVKAEILAARGERDAGAALRSLVERIPAEWPWDAAME